MRKLLSLSFMVMIFAAAALADVTAFQTVPNDVKNSVEFVSDATLERIVGHTSNIAGTLNLDLNDIMATKVGSFTVDLRTVDTGIAMRNGHLRDKYLHTEKNPNATFTLNKFVSSDKTSLKSGETANVVAEGDLSINGVSKTYQIPLKLTYSTTNAEAEQRLFGSKGDILAVSGQWPVKLADHQVEKPQMLMMRIADVQQLSIGFVMTDQLPPPKEEKK
jgi:polyisoprenoid-binding protein YceI